MNKLRMLPIILFPLALSLTGCAQGQENPPPTPPSASETTTAAKHQETDTAVPRLTVATDTGVSVIDATEMKLVKDFTTTAQPYVNTLADDRYVTLTYPNDNFSQILDTGTWPVAHGDHFHFYTADPQLTNTKLSGEKPVHVVSNGERTAVFFDGTGEAQVFRQAGLLIDSLEITKLKANVPHHGVAVPLENGKTIISTGDAAAKATGAQLLSADGKEEKTYTCPGLHGEAVHENTVVFGCADSILVIDEQGNGKNLPYPEQSENRAGRVYLNAETGFILGNYGKQALLTVENEQMKVIPLAQGYAGITLLPDNSFAALTVDGSLQLFAASGALKGSVPLIGAWTMPEGHGGIKPGITSIGHTVYVTDPAAGKVISYDTETQAKLELAGLKQPTNITASNAVNVGHAHEHDHENEAGHEHEHQEG